MSTLPQEPQSGSGHLTLFIVAAIVLAVIVAIVGPSLLGQEFLPFVSVFQTGGEVFLRMLQMVVEPLDLLRVS
jgi:Na+/H+-dicarboxylate symporter